MKKSVKKFVGLAKCIYLCGMKHGPRIPFQEFWPYDGKYMHMMHLYVFWMWSMNDPKLFQQLKNYLNMP